MNKRKEKNATKRAKQYLLMKLQKLVKTSTKKCCVLSVVGKITTDMTKNKG